MSNFKLDNIWTDKHTKAFLNLKAEMTNEPVLRGPKWDGSKLVEEQQAIERRIVEEEQTVQRAVEEQHIKGQADGRTGS